MAGKINVSQDTAKLVSKRFEIVSLGLKEIKGKGLMETFLADRAH